MIEALLKYQETDKKLRAIELELSGSEERKKAISAKKFLDGVEETVAKLEQRAFELNAAFVSATEELSKMREQEAEFRNALDGVSDEGSANYLIKKTDEILAKVKQLSQEVNKIAGEIQSVLKDYSSVKSSTKTAQAQYSEFGKKYNELKASKKDEMESIEKELSVLKKDVDPALMEKYLKKRKDKIFPIVYEINGNVCGACHMELSMAELSKLKNGEITECEQCRRLLYKSQNR